MEKDFYGFNIRLATENEIEDIHRITKISFEKYIKYAGLTDIEALNETYDDIKKDLKEKLVFVAFINEEAVGSVRIKINDDKTAYLSRFGVITQNQGVGNSMMNFLDGVMKSRNIEFLKLHTATKYYELIRFYYGRKFYVSSVSEEKGYKRALMVKEYNIET